MSEHVTVRIDDPELAAAIEEAEAEHGSRSEVLREAIRRAYLDDDATATTDDHTGLPKAAREGYAALREHANHGERLAIGAAESIIAQRVQLRKETVRSSVIRKLHGAGWIAVEQGIHEVGVVLRPQTASDGGQTPDDRDDDPFDGGDDADAIDVGAEFDRLEGAEIDRGEGVATDGGEWPTTTDEDLLRVITDRDPSEMSHYELYYEWHEAAEAARKATDAEVQQELHDRQRDLWSEMESRVDAEPPECPECGGASWSQTLGEPKTCDRCGLILGFGHEDLIDRVDAYWDAVRAPGLRPPEGGESDD
ncbi:ribbon-helix-helix protein, CopG family [Halobellus ordinarius]|uniref:ribbon-helix-helix protein, CopG family n=1 Tax=Halobellus ordinarius TaxID=3075120 RepID=UPI0028804EDE|nr:ribbon-helix-helix protein, CopG family [Halobellus sp. ZY16]